MGWCPCCWWWGAGEQVLLEEPLLEVSSLGPPQTPLLAVGGWIWVCRGDLGQYGCLLACHPRSPLGCAPPERIQLCSLRGGCVGPCGGLLHPGGLRCCPMVPYEQALLRAKQVQGGIAPSIINRGGESLGEKRALSARGPEGTMWEGRGERAAGLKDAQRGLQPAEPSGLREGGARGEAVRCHKSAVKPPRSAPAAAGTARVGAASSCAGWRWPGRCGRGGQRCTGWDHDSHGGLAAAPTALRPKRVPSRCGCRGLGVPPTTSQAGRSCGRRLRSSVSESPCPYLKG